MKKMALAFLLIQVTSQVFAQSSIDYKAFEGSYKLVKASGYGYEDLEKDCESLSVISKKVDYRGDGRPLVILEGTTPFRHLFHMAALVF